MAQKTLTSRALKTSHMRACAKFLRLDYLLIISGEG